ncbi:MAG: hypothetical protein HYS43_00495, partial [Candidatus Liptonbacteria bacterium]|nr:hypothetical protein [Candidatus Liptonbacteria bacterium]
GQYVDAVISGISFPAVKPDLELRRALDALSTGELFGRLRAADPARAALIDRRNRPRLIRALEIISATGSPVPATIRQSAEHLLFHRVLKIGIRFPREQLKERIRVRLAKRLRMGLIAEVKALHAAGLSWKRLDDLGLEYRFVARHLRGILSKEEMVAQLESAITAYAKRQMTWFKRDKDIVWFDRIPPSSAWNPIVRKFVLLFR